MADFFWMQESGEVTISRFKKSYGNNMFRPTEKLLIFGTDETYSHIQKGADFVTILGYCYYPGEPIQITASRILESFNESSISDLKTQLVGQFIMIIKKGNSMYIFADSLQVRNIFYSKDFDVMSSSFSVIEDILGTSINDLDFSKVVEYIAMMHIAYPSWLGNKTMHNKIRRLRSFEYLVIDTSSLTSRVGDVSFHIDNTKEFDLNKLSSKLLANLKTMIENTSFKDKKIGITLTGGYDTRLIAAIALKYYKKVSFRLATSQKAPGSILDSKIAKKIAKTINIPLEIYPMNENLIDQFYFLTEGMSPVENSVITPIIERTGFYALGFGGCFGTELWAPLNYSSIEALFLDAKRHIQANKRVWKQLRLSILEEFKNIRKHYILSVPNTIDFMRIFVLLSTAFFSSFMLSSYNIKGLQVEPYGHLNLLEIALKVPEEHMGKRESFRGTNLVQKMVMSKICYRIGKIQTTHGQPMLDPYTARSFPSYLLRYLKHLTSKLTGKIRVREKNKIRARNNHRKKVTINEVCYLSNGWDELFLRRIQEKYGINVDIH